MTGLQAMMVRCRDTGAPFAADLAVPRASGGLVWLSVHGEAVRDAEGAIILVRGTVQDITERKTAEAALRDSEAALQDAQRLAHIGNWSWQPGADSAIWSEEMFRIFRLNPRKGAPGFNGLEKLLGGDGLTRMREAAATCQADGTPFVLDIEARRADGVPIWISMHGEALRGRDGRVNRMRGTVQDITERKAAEAALKESETTLREAQRLSHIGSWERPIHGSGSHWSHELYRMFGLPPGAEAPSLEMLDRHLGPESGPRLRSALLACLRDGSAFTIDLEAIHSHGDKFWVSVHGEAVRDQSGTITTLRGTVQDITERKSAEQNIAKLHQQMEEQVRTLERHDEQMRTIARMSDLLQACHDRSEAFPIIAATAQTLFRHASGAIALAIEGTHQLETVVQWGAHPHMESQFTLNDCWALRTGRRYEMTAADRGAPCRHFDAAPDGPYVCLPLTVQGETGGLLHLGYPAGNLLDEEKLNLMTSFADVIKLSLANLGLRENLSEQALRDQLTGLFNRHYLAETLPREIRRAERDQVPLSIAVLDLDHFKRLNDTFGHDAGDTVLRAVGNLLRDAMRSADIACRYGGEEFLVVLPDCDAENARALIEKIREQIKTMSLTLRQTPLPAISISAGVAQMSGERSNSEALIVAADRALYAAKRNGRDRVETFTPERRTSPVPEKT